MTRIQLGSNGASRISQRSLNSDSLETYLKVTGAVNWKEVGTLNSEIKKVGEGQAEVTHQNCAEFED